MPRSNHKNCVDLSKFLEKEAPEDYLAFHRDGVQLLKGSILKLMNKKQEINMGTVEIDRFRRKSLYVFN